MGGLVFRSSKAGRRLRGAGVKRKHLYLYLACLGIAVLGVLLAVLISAYLVKRCACPKVIEFFGMLSVSDYLSYFGVAAGVIVALYAFRKDRIDRELEDEERRWRAAPHLECSLCENELGYVLTIRNKSPLSLTSLDYFDIPLRPVLRAGEVAMYQIELESVLEELDPGSVSERQYKVIERIPSAEMLYPLYLYAIDSLGRRWEICYGCEKDCPRLLWESADDGLFPDRLPPDDGDD